MVKNISAKRIFSALIFSVFLCTLQSCSKTGFKQMTAQSSEASLASVAPPTEKPPIPNPDLPVEIDSVVELPKITSSIPDCLPNTRCRIEFRLAKALTLPIKFNWRTDDDPQSQWKTGTLPANFIWGVAGAHYQSAFGDTTINAGERSIFIEIQNINQSASGIRIKLLLNKCQLGEISYRCQLFF